MEKRWIAVRILFVSIVCVIALLLALSGQYPIYGPMLLAIGSIFATLISVAWKSSPHVEITEADANPSAISESLGADEVNDTGVPVHDDSLVSEEAKRNGVLLECKNAWLTDKKLCYCRNFWLVSDMVAAKVDRDELAIKFNNGKTERFVLAPSDNVSDYSYGFKLVSKSRKYEVLSYHSRAKSRQWARVINRLILSSRAPPKQDTP
jgi:hypothetical protein